MRMEREEVYIEHAIKEKKYNTFQAHCRRTLT